MSSIYHNSFPPTSSSAILIIPYPSTATRLTFCNLSALPRKHCILQTHPSTPPKLLACKAHNAPLQSIRSSLTVECLDVFIRSPKGKCHSRFTEKFKLCASRLSQSYIHFNSQYAACSRLQVNCVSSLSLCSHSVPCMQP